MDDSQSPNDRSAWEAWLSEDEPEPDPLAERFTAHHFVSRSKGSSRGSHRPPRKTPFTRKRIAEVDLIADTWEPARPLRFRTEALFPFDVKATEFYDNPHAESDHLRQAIRKLR